jgi:hypothetical protein
MRRRRDEPDDRETVELAALADGTLPPERRAELEARVAASADLAERLAEQQRAVTLLRDASADVEAPAGLRARVEGLGRPRRRAVSGRPVLIGATAAAVAMVAVVVGLSAIDSTTSSDRFTAALAPTGLVPGAGGEATFTKTQSGWRIELDASGLPRLADGRFYQAWLRGPDGVLVPIGSFNEGSDVTLWAGVSPLDFGTLTVTRERADGDQASSGERVLVGTAEP